jgi:ribose 5-phosphate isomerase B
MTSISDDELRSVVARVVARILDGQHGEARPASPGSPQEERSRVVALGSDHGGFRMKGMLASHLQKAGFAVADCGTDSEASVDYPDFAAAVASKVAAGQAWRGIMIDGAGIGSCMVANKVRGIRAAMCYDHATALNSREHNDANVLTLGAGLIGDALARQIVDTWLSTEFGGGRHAPRVAKIMEIENQAWQAA